MKAGDFLLHFLLATGTALLVGLARRPARYDPFEDANVLHYGWIFRVVGCAGCLFGLTIGLAGLPSGRRAVDADTAVVFTLFTIGCAAVTAYAIPELTCLRILLTDRSITARSPWRLPRTIDWEDVSRVSYCSFLGWFVITGAEGETIRVPACLRGIAILADEVRGRLAPAVYAKAERGFAFHGLSRRRNL
jgi:hypothetical protein